MRERGRLAVGWLVTTVAGLSLAASPAVATLAEVAVGGAESGGRTRFVLSPEREGGIAGESTITPRSTIELAMGGPIATAYEPGVRPDSSRSSDAGGRLIVIDGSISISSHASPPPIISIGPANPVVVPEPSVAVLLGIGLMAARLWPVMSAGDARSRRR